MAERIIDMSTDDLESLIDEYNGYKEDVEDEISEIDGELGDLESESGEAIESIRESLRELKIEYESSLEELEELINILETFYSNISTLATKNVNLESINEHIKISADIIEDELIVTIDELFNDFTLESPNFEAFIEQKLKEITEEPNQSFVEMYPTQLPYVNESDSFYNLYYEHIAIMNKSKILKNKIDDKVDKIKSNGNIIIDLFGELDTLEKLTQNLGIDSDDYRRYANAGNTGAIYNFNLHGNNTNINEFDSIEEYKNSIDILNIESELDLMLSDETVDYLKVEQIGDGTMNERINEAWKNALLYSDYTELLKIYSELSTDSEDSKVILERLDELQTNTSTSLSNSIIFDYVNCPFKDELTDSEMYIEIEGAYLRSEQLNLFNKDFVRLFDEYYGHDYVITNFDFSELSIHDDGYIEGSIFYEKTEISFMSHIPQEVKYEYNVVQYKDSIENEIGKSIILNTNSMSFLTSLSSINPISDISNVIISLVQFIGELISDEEYANHFDSTFTSYFNSMINNKIIIEPHYQYMFIDILRTEYPNAYDFLLDAQEYIEEFGADSYYKDDFESNYDMSEILSCFNKAEIDLLSIISDLKT